MEYLISTFNYATGAGTGKWAGVTGLSTMSFYFSIGNWVIIGGNSSKDEDGSDYRVIPDAECDSLMTAKKNQIIFTHHNFIWVDGNLYRQDYFKTAILAKANCKIALNGHLTAINDQVVSGINCYSVMMVHLEQSRSLWFDCYSDGTFIKTEITGDVKT